jgi:uncharacterized protein (TIRG00374 family)
LFLYLALRTVNWNNFLATLNRANPILLGLGTVGSLVTYIILAVRWRILLPNGNCLSIRDAFDFVMIGNLAGLVLPSRLGDVARALLVGRRHQGGTSLALGSIMLERLLDVLMVLLLALGLSFFVSFPAIVQAGIITLALGMLVTLMGVVGLAFYEDKIPGVLGRLLALIPQLITTPLIGFISRFARGLQSIRSGRQLGLALLLSLVGWAVSGTVIICNITAFGLPVPWYAGLLVMLMINLGSTIPSSPGSIGVYHYLVILALSIWLPDKSAALSYAIVTHGIYLLMGIMAGSWSLSRQGLSLRSIASAPKTMS